MRCWWICVCWVSLAGCGRAHFGAQPDGPPDTPPPDAFAFGPFSAPVLVPAFSDPNEDDDPTLTDDLLEIYWEGQRWPGDKITFSQRAAVGEPWSTPIIAPGLEIGDSCPEVSHDGLTIMFSSNVAGGMGGADIYISTRMTRTSPWSTPVLIPELNSPANDYCAILTDTGLEVFFHSDRPGGLGNRDLYRAIRQTVTSPWEAPIWIGELNGPGNDESPWPFPGGGLEIIFTSEAAGTRDLYRATRSAVGEPFSKPIPIDELNTPNWEESDVWISLDGNTLFFESNRDTGNPEIYEAHRP